MFFNAGLFFVSVEVSIEGLSIFSSSYSSIKDDSTIGIWDVVVDDTLFVVVVVLSEVVVVVDVVDVVFVVVLAVVVDVVVAVVAWIVSGDLVAVGEVNLAPFEIEFLI